MAKKRKKYFNNVYNIPRLLFADYEGNIYEHPELLMTGMSFNECVIPAPDEIVELPPYSKLFFLPDTKPIGYDPLEDEFVVLDEIDIEGDRIKCFGVSAFMKPGFARLYLPGVDYSNKKEDFPLWAYTAVGAGENGKYYVSAFPVEINYKWDPANYDDRILLPEVEKLEKEFPRNRLLHHLKRCATEYHCFAGKNLFLRRWEAPLPVASACNSRCLGCLSLQSGKNICASHDRIDFTPTVNEIVELAVPHLNFAEEGMVSFGQGCEGEPLTQTDLIADCIKEIRKKTGKGTININTNGSQPHNLLRIIKAGLNSVRVSINSILPDIYNAYYKPVNYNFEDVIESCNVAKKEGIFTMVNYLIFPGVSDTEEEFEALKAFLNRIKINFLHFKNLCIDPSVYIEQVGKGKGNAIGIRALFELLKNEFPDVEIGYFNKNIAKHLGYD